MCSGSRKEMCSISYYIPYNSDAFNVESKTSSSEISSTLWGFFLFHWRIKPFQNIDAILLSNFRHNMIVSSIQDFLKKKKNTIKLLFIIFTPHAPN